MVEPFRIFDILQETGGRLALCRLPGRSGDLLGDLGLLAAWTPAILVSMTGEAEAAGHGARHLAVTLAEAGIGHAWFPIRDFGTPEQADQHWPPLAARLHAHLDRGEGVALHCLGGKGRSGMIATRLLIERGLSPGLALAAVRAARPGAVETRAQAEWAANGAAPLSLRKFL